MRKSFTLNRIVLYTVYKEVSPINIVDRFQYVPPKGSIVVPRDDIIKYIAAMHTGVFENTCSAYPPMGGEIPPILRGRTCIVEEVYTMHGHHYVSLEEEPSWLYPLDLFEPKVAPKHVQGGA